MAPFKQKDYRSIAKDILAQVTEGRVREIVRSEPNVVKYLLASQPVRDIERVDGVVNGHGFVFERAKHFRLAQERPTEGGEASGYLEWISSPAQRPDINSEFTVTYLLDVPVLLSDSNVGSVLRTIIESVSREIEYLYLQLENVYNSAFIDKARGNSLDLVVSILGITRKPEEDDESLKYRAKRELAISARATLDAINGSLAKYPLKSNPSVLEDDEPGIVHVVLDATDAQNNEIVESINKTKAAGIVVKFHEAESVEVEIELSVVLKENISFLTVRSEIENRVRNYFSSLGIGEAIRISRLELSLAEMAGVEEISRPEILLEGGNRTTQNVQIGSFERAMLKTINVKQVTDQHSEGAIKA
jgi:hypothetical protein